MALRILGAGAVQGLVQALAPAFTAETGHQVEGTFGAVGAMRDALLAGRPADIVVLSETLMDALARDGHVEAGSRIAVGTVQTGIAVRVADPLPRVGNAAELAAALSAADAIYVPDPARATAGIHFVGVLEKLGLRARLEGKLRAFANGATAMRALAEATGRPIGCTQITEILSTPGVALVGLLPPSCGLATVYVAAVTAAAPSAHLARDFTRRLAGEEARALRTRLGFDA
jgi:molybdate transport system substrate-binding protein